MSYLKKIFIFILISPVYIYAGTSDDVFAKITLWWRSFFVTVNSFSWIFAMLPLVVAGYAISAARKKTISESERGAGQNTAIDKVGREVKYVIIAIICLYIIYGTFGRVYADAPHFTTTWEKLVFDFWQGVLDV